MELPENLQPFQKEAELYLTKGLVKEIEFSAATYQVLVKDLESGRPIWTFLQLDKDGALKDFFCDDEEGEEELTPCVHVCAAYLRLFNKNDTPLGERFENSLWNHLGRLYADRLGDDPSLLRKEGNGAYTHHSGGGKLLFAVKAKTPTIASLLKDLLEKRPSDTEETSLKFSNLSQEELKLWREGRPSLQLKYELSFWSDLARLLMTMQDDNEPYKITFDYSDKGIPNIINIDFKKVVMTFYLSEANLPIIIPSLATVKSNLKVYDAPEEEIKRILYDKKEGCLIVEAFSKTKASPKSIKHKNEGITLDRWIFVPSDGFYAKDPHWLLSAGKICGEDISAALQEHFSLINKFLEDTTLHEEPLEVSYHLAFDPEWNLHITVYVFSPGDLSFPDSRFFGEWAYLDDEGFYKLEGVIFPDIETIISPDFLPDFIARNRSWLNIHEGFHVHSSSIEAQLQYELNDEGRLSFIGQHELSESASENYDFGSWVYVASQGFYSKISQAAVMTLRAGMSIAANQIPLFIKVNREELEQVPKFFSETSPIEHVRLDVKMDNKENITVNPIHTLKKEYAKKQVRFFDDFTYVPGEGFHELPSSLRPPERFSHFVEIESENLEFFITQELPLLQPYIATIDKRLVRPEKMELVVLNIDKPKESGGLFEYIVSLNYVTEVGSVPTTDLWHGIKRKKKFLFSSAGLIYLHDKRFDWIRWIHKAQVSQQEKFFKLSTIELIRLYALEEISIKTVKTDEQKRSFRLLQDLIELKPPEDPDVTGLKSPLRPYQKIGVQWLWFLAHYGLSGLLCDDMGLGKTHQTMALIASLMNAKKTEKRSSPLHVLVVCPTSVIYHWQEKLKEHLPGIRIHTFYGAGRTLEGFHHDYDILLTSYGICRLDNKALSGIPFQLAVFDEIQLAKNHNSRLYATLVSIDAKMRLGLTGTPIENHLRELKALFDIVLPLYMPSEVDFREFFIKPIEKESDSGRKKLLTRMIKPFVMRRKKQDVLVDLPDKVEEISHCDLISSQAHLYNEVLRTGRARILDELQDEKIPVSYIHIFSLLSGLKQICDHPAVYLKCPHRYKEFSSGKWELFVELLSEARESQQKIVIYSQYLMMLDIIEAYLLEIGVGFASIRGATTNRGEQLHRFHNDPSCEVFVASLQAAGLGIDLTAASVVIHYDRWWNAARENQATDRVHRIGQKRGVQVFKLVTKDTFEERIDALITKKGELMENVVGVDDHEVIKSFTRKELIEFLQDSKVWEE